MQGEAAGQTVSTIPWSKYTHVIHYAIKPVYSNGSCTWDTSYGISGSNITNFVSAAHAAGVKAIIGIMQDDSVSAIQTCTNSSHIAQFVNAISSFVGSNGYDGVDIDWESGIIASQYQDLITRIRAAMPSTVLTTAVTVTERYLTAGVQDKLDQINLMAYDLDFSDLSGANINYTWYNAPTLQGSNSQNNAMDILAWYYVSDAGNSSRKIGIGVPFYGRIKTGCMDSGGSSGVTDPNQTWVSGGGRSAILYRDLVNSSYWNSGTRVWDDNRKSQYIRYKGGNCSSDAFIPFTGAEQIAAVAAMIKANNYGGMMTYGIPYEFISGQQGDAQYPLSSAMYNAMVGGGGGTTTPPTSTDPAAPAITTASPLTAGTVGTAYSLQLTASGSAPLSWSLPAGSLPAGLSLAAGSGAITGTPSTAGTSTFTVTVSNSAGSSSATFSLTINATQQDPQTSAPVITSTSPLQSGTVGTPYSLTFGVTSSTPVSWSLPAGSLPAGLWLAAGSGAITGTPSTTGTWNFTVQADNGSGTTSKSFALTIGAAQTASAPVITTSSLPSGTVGTAYSAAVTATSDSAVTWSLPAGSLPAGLSLAASSGAITGTPSAAGTFTFTVQASSSAGSTSKTLSVVVTAPASAPVITTSSLPGATAGTAYSATLTATSDTAVTWSLPAGALPTGLSLAASSGAITGTPSSAGTWSFTVQASSNAGSTSKTLSLAVAAPAVTASAPVITTSTLPGGTVGAPYAAALGAVSDTAVTWSLPAGSLPPGLWLAAGSGAIEGMPTTAGTWTFTVQATNGAGSAKQRLSLTIASAATLSITTSSLPRGYVGNAYSVVLQTTSTSPVSWSLPAGSLPPGLWLAADSGAIEGTPSQFGNWAFTVAASDGTRTASQSFRLSIKQ